MLSRKKILIVEDSEINRAILREILIETYEILEAENGQEALRILEKRPGEVSLILLDIIMPVMDGYTFLSAMKTNPDIAPIPVIVTTQSDRESDEVSALSHGATDFVAKPYKPQVILHRVASLIKLRETAAMINQFQYDRLTGLLSKAFFYQRVRETLLLHPEREFDILCSDIENFKLVNDLFGVSAGDRLLRSVADLHKNYLGEGGLCGRLDADQFACLVARPEAYNDQMFRRATDQINATSTTRNVAIKWGVYPVDDRALPVEHMCDRALLAARGIKGQYGKLVATYDDALRGKLLREQEITNSMDTALAEGQFLLYLQPKYRIRDGQLSGAEALVRWDHPQWGFQSPAEFIPLFERNGFITKLDQFVWDQACAILRKWQDQGNPPCSVSVNVSRADIYQENLAEILTDMIQKHNLPPSCLHLEITESAYTENPTQLIETVKHLRDLGFIIEMDDFGSGYSSLNMLNKMPIDVLKLDMNFIQSETAKPVNQGILHFIMNLARWMELSVVAEGVETWEQLERLREVGCDFVQEGYYFAKPMPVEAFEVLLRQQPRRTTTTQRPPLSKRDRQSQVVLVADEDPAYRAAVRATFQERFQVEEMDSGEMLLDVLTEDRYPLAAVILSSSLATVEKSDTLRLLRQKTSAWNVPFIVTGPRDPASEEQALELGADDFAGKPHSQKTLWTRVLRAMGAAALREREHLLQEEAHRDYLTGLLNRRGLAAAVKELESEDGPLAVYLFDLDNLKQINDTFGHTQGDRLIQQFGALLRSHSRRTDTLCRFGGDEFLVLMKQMENPANAVKKGQEICQSIREAFPLSQIPASCTAGVALCSPSDTLGEMISRADAALYHAKTEHKGACCLWRERDT